MNSDRKTEPIVSLHLAPDIIYKTAVSDQSLYRPDRSDALLLNYQKLSVTVPDYLLAG